MYPALEDGGFAGRSQAFAVYHAHAADAVLVRLADEVAQGLACIVAAQAVQVELALDAPVAPAQFARHIGADAGLAKAHVLVSLHQRADVKLVADGFDQHGLVVQLGLAGDWFGPRFNDHCAALVGQRVHNPGGVDEQVFLGGQFGGNACPFGCQ